ncbi:MULTISPECIES: NucA/NucB deoxyribonuclease domain-containing protein [Bacillus]|uniref:Sporulation protein n=1 Tax=Bacillus pumilus TaxID=1408 RepID=A0A2G8IXC4_BACPU|nr:MULTISPECIES: NucA/NucB deoxyribonuclease domain-containing protein [Bacillus]MCC9089712.1 sporulation protein [Bacillus pumilus]MED1747622.1 NucA/NucB deoxyribonuclease domain-containing protein [Bacillus zhangzhouensis]PIK28175.1 sporulation protein [Bacillus pumilus]UUD43089.1 NucA/NucB deoxyribonuclease domain-containing protein [Bacillus pumilus]
MKLLKTILLLLLIVIGVATGYIQLEQSKQETTNSSYDKTIHFPSDRYPETAKHIEEAIEEGQSSICTIDRKNSDEQRDRSLHGIPTKRGYDRDEWPMAMCKEGGKGASVKYVRPSDNRGAGSWVSHQLSDDPDGTKIQFIID